MFSALINLFYEQDKLKSFVKNLKKLTILQTIQKCKSKGF